MLPFQVRSPLDVSALQSFLLSSKSGLQWPPAQQRQIAAVHQFGHGQSNPTFLVSLSSASSPAGTYSSPHGSQHKSPAAVAPRIVLRKKPAGKILASAHAVEREYAVISALSCYSSTRNRGRSDCRRTGKRQMNKIRAGCAQPCRSHALPFFLQARQMNLERSPSPDPWPCVRTLRFWAPPSSSWVSPRAGSSW